MRSGRRDITLPLFGLGVVLVVIAILGGGNLAFGAADILIGVAIGMYAARGAPPQARNPQLYLLGLVIARRRRSSTACSRSSAPRPSPGPPRR